MKLSSMRLLLITLVGLALLFAACGGGGGPSPGGVEPTPTATSEPAQGPGAGVPPSDALQSFRFGAETAVEVDGGLVLTADGEFRAPDRLRCAIGVSSGGEAISRDELVVVGDSAWIDSGGGFRATASDDPDVAQDLDLCPGWSGYWEGFDFLKDPSPISGQPDSRNGVNAARYSLGDAAEALGAVGFSPAELQGVTIRSFDAWLAEDGGWPVAISADFSLDAASAAETLGLPAEEGGQPARITMRVDITDANGTDIRVEEPAEPPP